MSNRIKHCNHCGKVFELKDYRQKYCGAECQLQEQKDRRKRWIDSKPEGYLADYMREYRKRKKKGDI